MADASLRELQARRAALVAKVNGLLNRSSGTSIDSIFAAGLPSMPLDTAALAQQAINRHPMLARARVLQQQSQIMQELARANLVPSPMIMARYGNRGTKDGIYEIGVSVPIPLHLDQRQRGAIRATGEMERMRERETAGAEREIRAMVEETVARIQAARIMWESYQSDLLPQARQAVESSIAGYATGMSHFEQPLLAAQTLQRIEQETLNSELMVRRMLVELEASRGTAAEIAQGKSEFVR
jgi:cobalt-zinc-cadmium efflux system outer membrane protein